MATTKVRVPGGGNTFIMMGAPGKNVRLAFLANVNDQPGRAVGNVTPIHPIGSAYPVDFATPYAQGMGTLTLTVWATWGKDAWVSAFTLNDKTKNPWDGYKTRHGYKNAEPVDLREVLEAQRQLGGYMQCHKYELGKDGTIVRVKNYKNCVITDIDASDNVSIETMEQRVRITCNYSYVTVTKGSGKGYGYGRGKSLDISS